MTPGISEVFNTPGNVCQAGADSSMVSRFITMRSANPLRLSSDISQVGAALAAESDVPLAALVKALGADEVDVLPS